MTNITTRSTKTSAAGYWFALIEADDDYGQPTAVRSTTSYATRAEADAASDFGAVFVPHAPRVVPARNHQLPAHFVAAREAAMRMGRTVRVTA